MNQNSGKQTVLFRKIYRNKIVTCSKKLTFFRIICVFITINSRHNINTINAFAMYTYYLYGKPITGGRLRWPDSQRAFVNWFDKRSASASVSCLPTYITHHLHSTKYTNMSRIQRLRCDAIWPHDPNRSRRSINERKYAITSKRNRQNRHTRFWYGLDPPSSGDGRPTNSEYSITNTLIRNTINTRTLNVVVVIVWLVLVACVWHVLHLGFIWKKKKQLRRPWIWPKKMKNFLEQRLTLTGRRHKHLARFRMLGELLQLGGRTAAGHYSRWTIAGFHVYIAQCLGECFNLTSGRWFLGRILSDRIANVEERIVVRWRREWGAIIGSLEANDRVEEITKPIEQTIKLTNKSTSKQTMWQRKTWRQSAIIGASVMRFALTHKDDDNVQNRVFAREKKKHNRPSR